MTNEERVHALVDAGELEIDDAGRIWRVAVRRGRKEPLRLVPMRRRRAEKKLVKGYLQVRARFGNGERVHAAAHRLVWFHFNGPIPDGMEINHRNGRKPDNRPANLEVTTRSGNVLHEHRTLGVMVREHHTLAKLTTKTVIEIRKRHAAGEGVCALAREFGVDHSTVSSAVARRSWATVP